jgi:quercetin dioxygenase-like cupin family protein
MKTQMKYARILAPLIALIVVVPASVADDQAKGPFSHILPNVPGKSLTAVEVSYAPGQASPPHHHAKSAFIYVYVVSGQIASQVDDQPERVYKAGESFYETPGAHHLVSRNASQTEPAKMLAVFVVDTADKTLTTPDK